MSEGSPNSGKLQTPSAECMAARGYPSGSWDVTSFWTQRPTALNEEGTTPATRRAMCAMAIPHGASVFMEICTSTEGGRALEKPCHENLRW